MRLALAFSIVLWLVPGVGHAQTDVWTQVNTQPDPQPEPVKVSKEQLGAIKKALIAAGGPAPWPCDLPGEDWSRTLTFANLPSSSGKMMLVEAGPGCARGGQGSNGAMWVLRFKDEEPVVVATPRHGFSGWLYSIQPTIHHRLPDLVLGWHMSAYESNLSYFQFDGSSYRLIDKAVFTADDNGNVQIVRKQSVTHPKEPANSQ